jgi:hypothetical protein
VNAHVKGCPNAAVLASFRSFGPVRPPRLINQDGQCTFCGARVAEPLRSAEPVAHGLTERQIRAAARERREQLDKHPTREDVAAALHTSVATLARAMRKLGMSGWPPPSPED